MPSKGSGIYLFGRFALNLDRGVLLADGVERALRAKSIVMLTHFAENPGRLIDRDEIMAAVWPGVFVSDDSIAQCISDIRRVLDDDDKLLLRTVQRRGYLFAPDIRREPFATLPGKSAEIPNQSGRPPVRGPGSCPSRCCHSRT